MKITIAPTTDWGLHTPPGTISIELPGDDQTMHDVAKMLRAVCLAYGFPVSVVDQYIDTEWSTLIDDN